MKSPILLIPGMLGSSLQYEGPRKRLITLWLDKTLLAVKGLGTLALDSGGVEPLPPGGYQLSPGTLLEVYRPMARRLQSLYREEFDVGYVAYDWRLSPEISAANLVDVIRQRASPDFPAYLVAHSLGGVVAKRAWSLLKKTNQENLIARIVAIASPFYGSYSCAEVWGLWDSLTNDLARLNTLLGSSPLTNPFWPLAPSIAETKATVKTINTWPSVYATLPMLGPTQKTFDPKGAVFYDLERHRQDIGISAAWMDWTVNVWQKDFLNPLDQPPSSVLKCVAGVSPERGALTRQTIQRLWVPEQLQDRLGYFWSDGGDGVVSVWSACSASEDYFLLPAEHQTIIEAPIVLAKIDEWLFPRSPAPPIPLPQAIEKAFKLPPAPSVQVDPGPLVEKLQQGMPLVCAAGGCKC